MTRDNWGRLQASNSFTPEEIGAFKALMGILRRGGSPDALLRSGPMRKVESKFIRMGARIEEVKRDRAGKPKPTREEILDANE